MNRDIVGQESQIKESLFGFVKSHIPDADLNLIDEIVLSYVVAILEDVSSDPVFDVEGFCEMMRAYFPEFESINHSTICQWIFELAAKLQTDEPHERDISLIELSLPEILPKAKPRFAPPPSSHARKTLRFRCRYQITSESFDRPKRIYHLSETSDGSTDGSCGDFLEEVDTLQEMFPSVCSIEIKHCVAIACGDVERASQILIHRQENGQSVNANGAVTLHLSKQPTIDDQELKNRIIERYSYIDRESDIKEHRPVAPKVEPKKLIRYRDNKIVSLKGERYTEVKKGEDVDDVSLKKQKKGQSP
ncbi:CUE domain-containing protein 2-A isoform X1 [Photinus pyralis]|uniref:CUE domain-containing protein 2-A isoform X1 n=1 Tax=Photinus pyralis TaxID=7054 RepID=UPI001266FFB5|nr:CUE domain-containing protein 2-A isoform X1 [Photinus pyralis]